MGWSTSTEVNPSSKLDIGMVESACYWPSQPQFLLTSETFMNNLEQEFYFLVSAFINMQSVLGQTLTVLTVYLTVV
jgi:hypothetical protein